MKLSQKLVPVACARWHEYVVLKLDGDPNSIELFYQFCEAMGYRPREGHLPYGTGLLWALPYLSKKHAHLLTRKVSKKKRAKRTRH